MSGPWNCHEQVECIRDCYGACCQIPIIIGLNLASATKLRERGVRLDPLQKEAGGKEEVDYWRYRCLVNDSLCPIHEDSTPACSRFPAGGKGCLRIRYENPTLVRRLTGADKEFARWQNGESDYD